MSVVCFIRDTTWKRHDVFACDKLIWCWSAELKQHQIVTGISFYWQKQTESKYQVTLLIICEWQPNDRNLGLPSSHRLEHCVPLTVTHRLPCLLWSQKHKGTTYHQ
ncbi:hypothetical protein TNCV_1376161 [Trichonephila clavipes]|nr:hypothetical protein TNCV_1376161 [Trichonephila clavipes]